MKKLFTLLVILSLYSCSSNKGLYKVDSCPMWADNIHNPENEEFVVEVAFNLGISPKEVTQQMFDERYGSH